MNYSDFGVTCAEELEQDEWSLTRPTFETPKGGVLTVVGWKGRKGSHKSYVLKCSLCAEDTELFGDGVFIASKGSLSNGCSPCGCTTGRLSERQYKVRVEREANERGYMFTGWAETFSGFKTKCLLVCPTHGMWSSSTAVNFLRGSGCPQCGNKKGNQKNDTLHTEEFMKSGAFLPGTKFWRAVQGTLYWSYTCPRCSHDEYVKAGLCCGIFTGQVSNFKNGHPACRCSPFFRWTKEQREYQVKKEMKRRHEKGVSSLLFVGWATRESHFNGSSRFNFLCPEHGEQSKSLDSFFLQGSDCPQCAGSSQRQCYIHRVMDEGLDVALKLGIAKDWQRRLRNQNTNNLFQSENIGVWEFKEVKDCKAAERECKQTLQTGVLSAREMKDGWTETVSVLDLEKVIAIYEKHGGKRIK